MAGIWPDDIHCVAVITFDVDGITSWLNRNPDFINYPSLLSMAEYGPSVATPRILDMLDAQGIPGSFYIPGYVAETQKSCALTPVSTLPRLHDHIRLHPVAL